MAENTGGPRKPRVWIAWIGFAILLIFLYFYKPFENLVSEGIRGVSGSTVIFWFAALVGVVAYAIAHWQSFRSNIVRAGTELDVSGLVFDTLQIAILVAVIFFAGATLQAVEMLAEQLMGATESDRTFGSTLISIVVLMILTVLFYLLHYVVRAFRDGWHTRRPPPQAR